MCLICWLVWFSVIVTKLCGLCMASECLVAKESHWSEVTWASWRPQSPTNRPFVQHLVQICDNKSKLRITPRKGSIMRKAFPCHDVIMNETILCLASWFLFAKQSYHHLMKIWKGTEPWWRIYASVNKATISPGSGFSPVRHQTIIWINVNLMSIRPIRKRLNEAWFKYNNTLIYLSIKHTSIIYTMHAILQRLLMC